MEKVEAELASVRKAVSNGVERLCQVEREKEAIRAEVDTLNKEKEALRAKSMKLGRKNSN